MVKPVKRNIQDVNFDGSGGDALENALDVTLEEADIEARLKVVKHVTRPTLSLKKVGTIVYFTVQEPFATDTAPQKNPNEKAAVLLKVLNLRNGKPSQIVAPFILQKELGTYGDDGYVGRSFKVTVGDVVNNQNGVNRTRMLEVLEIKVD